MRPYGAQAHTACLLALRTFARALHAGSGVAAVAKRATCGATRALAELSTNTWDRWRWALLPFNFKAAHQVIYAKWSLSMTDTGRSTPPLKQHQKTRLIDRRQFQTVKYVPSWAVLTVYLLVLNFYPSFNLFVIIWHCHLNFCMLTTNNCGCHFFKPIYYEIGNSKMK